MKNSLIINVMDDTFEIVLLINSPHFDGELVQSYKIEEQNDDETECVLNKDGVDVDLRVLLWS
jgi:hypothetical protein